MQYKGFIAEGLGEKPKGPVEIDTDDPYSIGLVDVVLDNSINYVTRQPLDTTNVPYVADQLVFDGDDKIQVNHTPFEGTNEWTVVITAAWSSGSDVWLLGANAGTEQLTFGKFGIRWTLGLFTNPVAEWIHNEADVDHVFCLRRVGDTFSLWENGILRDSGDETTWGDLSITSFTLGGNDETAYWNGTVDQYYSYNYPFTDDQIREISKDPYRILKPVIPSFYLVPAAAGGITGTGALSSAAAALSATGKITKTGTGALTAQASAVAGTGLREITGTAAIVADASTLAGSGTVGAVVTGTGALTAQDSAIAATGLREITGTAALTSDAATIAGTGLREITGTGALAAGVSTVAGAGQVGNIVSGSGAIAAQAAAVAGAGIITRVGTGALEAQAAQVAGTGTLTANITGTGALIALDSTIAGVGVREITGTGALASQAATISGAEVVVIYDEIELAVTITREQSLQMTVTREVST